MITSFWETSFPRTLRGLCPRTPFGDFSPPHPWRTSFPSTGLAHAVNYRTIHIRTTYSRLHNFDVWDKVSP